VTGALRPLGAFLAGVAVGACAAPTPPAKPVSGALAATTLASQTVALVRHKADGATVPYCTGVWVDWYAIVTAYHCLPDHTADRSVLYVAPEDVYGGAGAGDVHARGKVEARVARVARLDEAHDLALLTAASAPWSHGVAELGSDVRAGDRVQAMGHPIGRWWSYSTGDVAAVRQWAIDDIDILWIQATVPISPGSSGCGLFDSTGRLVGVAHASYTYGQGVNVFVHGMYVDALLRGGQR